MAFTVILATVAFVPRITETGGNIPYGVAWAFLALQLYGILSLMVGGFLALHTLRVARYYVWSLEDERNYVTRADKNAQVSWYLRNNQLVSVLKSNFLDASYICIRNGVAALALSAILMLILLVIHQDQAGPSSLPADPGAVRLRLPTLH